MGTVNRKITIRACKMRARNRTICTYTPVTKTRNRNIGHKCRIWLERVCGIRRTRYPRKEHQIWSLWTNYFPAYIFLTPDTSIAKLTLYFLAVSGTAPYSPVSWFRTLLASPFSSLTALETNAFFITLYTKRLMKTSSFTFLSVHCFTNTIVFCYSRW